MEEESRRVFESVSEYADAQLTATCSEYELLQKLNKAAEEEVTAMTTAMQGTNENMETINKQQQELQPLLDQVDALSATVAEMLASAQALDEYSRSLETRFKSMTRR